MSTLKISPAFANANRTNDFVSSDMMALASHMDSCAKSHGRFSTVRMIGEQLHSLTAPRIVSTAMFVGVCAIALFAFA